MFVNPSSDTLASEIVQKIINAQFAKLLYKKISDCSNMGGDWFLKDLLNKIYSKVEFSSCDDGKPIQVFLFFFL